MNSLSKAVLGLVLAVCAVPASAAEADCLEQTDASISARLTDQFFYEEGLGNAPQPFFEDMQAALAACLAKYSVPDQHSLVFTELNVGTAMKAELARRLLAAGADVGKLDRGMVPHIPNASTTYDEMFDRLGPEFDTEADRLSSSGRVSADMADALLGAYTGAFHSAFVSQLQWNARK